MRRLTCSPKHLAFTATSPYTSLLTAGSIPTAKPTHRMDTVPHQIETRLPEKRRGRAFFPPPLPAPGVPAESALALKGQAGGGAADRPLAVRRAAGRAWRARVRALRLRPAPRVSRPARRLACRFSRHHRSVIARGLRSFAPSAGPRRPSPNRKSCTRLQTPTLAPGE